MSLRLGSSNGAQMTFNHEEQTALKTLVDVICATQGLSPNGSSISCGRRLTKNWCENVAKGLESFLKESGYNEDTIVIHKTDVTNLRTIAESVMALFPKNADTEISTEDFSLLESYADILEEWKGADDSQISVGNHNISPGKIRGLISFLKNVKGKKKNGKTTKPTVTVNPSYGGY